MTKPGKTETVKPRKNVDPVPERVAKCSCADWTYVKEFGEWAEGEHHPNCEEGRRERERSHKTALQDAGRSS